MTAVSRLAALLAEHQWRTFHAICQCGDPAVAYDDHPDHVAAVVEAAADLAIVEVKPHPDAILDCSNSEVWVRTGIGGDRDYMTVDGEYYRSFDAVMKMLMGGGAVALARVPWASDPEADRG